MKFYQHGFTLLELIITMAIVGILSTIAAPFFGDFIAKYRVELATQELQRSFAAAKSEAQTLSITTAITPVNSSNNPTNWNTSYTSTPTIPFQYSQLSADDLATINEQKPSWIVRSISTNPNYVAKLITTSKVPSDVQVKISVPLTTDNLTFNPSAGFQFLDSSGNNASNITFHICSPNTSKAVNVTIRNSGQSIVEQVTSQC